MIRNGRGLEIMWYISKRTVLSFVLLHTLKTDGGFMICSALLFLRAPERKNLRWRALAKVRSVKKAFLIGVKISIEVMDLKVKT